jgi:iron complex transport system ATP-binding protein
MSRLLTATALSVRADAKQLLDGIDLSFGPGETVALVGPNGAGKSTLLRVLSASLRPHSGQVLLNGNELASYPPRVLALHRAVMAQQTSVAFPFVVAEVVRMGMGGGSGARIETLVDATLAELGLLDVAGRVMTSLSGGEQQRVHLARVLVQLAYGMQHGGSGILLLDEPTSSLDLRHQLGMLKAIKCRAQEGALAIVILHDLNLAALFAERVVVLNHGRIDCDGTPAETITSEMLERVLRITTTVGRPPMPNIPFVLPQVMAAAGGSGDDRP